MKKTGLKLLTSLVAIMIIFASMGMSANAYTSRCAASNCNNKVVSGSNYCSTHKCKKSGCSSRGLQKYNGYCSNSHKPKSTSSSTKKSSYGSNSSTKKSSYTSKKSYQVPDCDDYEDYDDFMDDWDGYMPNGSDAEDYWEDW